MAHYLSRHSTLARHGQVRDGHEGPRGQSLSELRLRHLNLGLGFRVYRVKA
jgi:hypothetical protein